MEKLGTILLIDDDLICCYFNRQILKEMGVVQNTVCLNDGQEALDYLERVYASSTTDAALRPALIFLDLNMSGLDGFQVLDHLNEMGGGEDLVVERVVILSTSMHPSDQERASGYDVFDYLVKPLTETKVKGVIDRFLQSQQLNSKTQNKEPAPRVVKDRPPKGKSVPEVNKKEPKKKES